MRTVANLSIPLRTGSEVKEAFAQRGLSISEWARRHGFSAQLVYQVLSGRKRCLRGQSHQIAVRLQLKRGVIGSVDEIDLLCPEPSAALKTVFDEEPPMAG
jgi:gp16 family phage-associated protein